MELRVAERVRLLAAGDGRSSSASLRTDAFASSKIASGDFVELGGLTRAILALARRAHCVRPNSLLRICRPLTLHRQIKKGLKDRPFFIWRRG